MKLLFCIKCGDIFNLDYELKKCKYGETSGRYIDNLNAEISGNYAQPIGFANNSFNMAMAMQRLEDDVQAGKPVCCDGVRFDAFFIPSSATSIKKVKK